MHQRRLDVLQAFGCQVGLAGQEYLSDIVPLSCHFTTHCAHDKAKVIIVMNCQRVHESCSTARDCLLLGVNDDKDSVTAFEAASVLGLVGY